MKNILLGLVVAVLFLGCNEPVKVDVEKETVVGNSLKSLKLNDQFEKPQKLDADTKKVIFAFSKDMGHLCNDYFVTQDPDFLTEHHALFIANVSAAPSLIRSMFIMPGLKEFKHTVLVIEDENVAASYRIDAHEDELMVLDVNDFIIEKISYVSTQEELVKALSFL